MASDIVYYFDNITKRRYSLGEIQTNFNFNLVIDGDKDSEQVNVYSFHREALRPNTIIYHPSTDSWWVVKKDKVERNASEDGFWYNHSITLNGAIDLLKNRDLTDCGFNANNYTIDTFFKKLLKLSNFEYNYQIEYGNNVDKDKKVDYIKSYENYVLLSAIRDFFNGYNCEVKMSFETRIGTNRKAFLDYAIFTIIPRTGNVGLPTIDISHFDDVRENINFDKESFGTTVVSNAQNVISTEAKTYPQVGGVRITGSDYETTIDSAYIKLPSPAWKVNWVKMICPLYLILFRGNVSEATSKLYTSKRYYPNEYLKAIDDLLNRLSLDEEKEIINQNTEKIRELFENCSLTFFNNPSYNPMEDYPSDSHNGKVIKEANTPYIPILDNDGWGSNHTSHQVVLMDKDSKDLLKNKQLALVWERSSDKITGLSSINEVPYNIHSSLCDLHKLGYDRILVPKNNFTYNIIVCYNPFAALTAFDPYVAYQRFVKGETCFQVNYIPMSDLKVKQDNENNTKDIQLYNQNGKLNDSVALSKMVDSYSKEITNPTITRYMEYTNFDDIPKIGQIVIDGNDKYVINNISYNVYPNESNDDSEVGYYFECEFTLALFVSTKSIMTSPNTNVRDYGIPQKYNIKRRQTYRDYYEFGFSEEGLANKEKPYAKLENYLQLGFSSAPKDFSHTALIKIDYEEEVGGQMSWYYQLNSTVYTMAKSVYEVVDFDDNNIIGYDIQNSTTGFNMSDLWSSTYRAVTTPVSYVDDNGKFIGITLQMTSSEILANAYSQVDTQGESVMLSAHCFINDELYDLIANPNGNEESLADYVINEPNYEKDAIEVPVFEYSLQLGDTSEVEVGDNILLNRECIFQCMNCVTTDGELTTLNATKYQGDLVASGGSYNQQEDKREYSVIVGIYPVITFEDNNTKMRIKFYNNNRFLVDGNQDQDVFSFVGEAIPITPTNPQMSKNFFIGKDIVIFKNYIQKLFRDDEEEETSVEFDRDLMFIVHRPTEEQFDGNDLILKINHYKLN